MKINRIAQVGALAAVAALALAGCAANEGGTATDTESASTLSGTLSATGASSQTAAQEAWVAAFQTANPDVTINYEPTGSGTGRENFIAGASNFIGSDRAFNDEEIAAGGFASCADDGAAGIVELPLYISPIAIIFNLDGIDSLDLDAKTVAGIFAGTITNWNDAAIADLNPGVDLPDLAISPVHRSDDSGTTENFTDYLNVVAPDVWSYEADGEWPLDSGEAAQGTSGVVAAVTGGQGTIGYADASQAGDLGTVAIEVGGEFVSYSPEAAAALVDASPEVEGRTDGDIAIELDRTTDEAGVYPIALVSYLIGCVEYEDSNVADLVSQYFSYIASPEGQDAAASNAGSAPISDSLRTQVESAIALIK
ncbi:phosphate transport system substrate-binding protein [Microbacterium endophyticum]|uniref:Phosphate-binding protein n=1 Tax=Microbacterium endophyticum TaxID=1526412 RepID=A0A7W4V2D5_9MICO|nr:phosphate ABC transporter substrate-binding protein PstS [Microbacterium endophyticum]MBB2975050.1 phosphate transport system substrate-binding protein [Microbacterium endophyticum]NIK37410.1 phosphate transport system substrate-binding protein [Microbacterium endophyticum]